MFDDDDFPAVEDDGMPAWADADADITALQESEDRCVVRLATTGCKTSPSTAGCLRGFTKRCIWRNRRDSGACSEKEELKESCSIQHREG